MIPDRGTSDPAAHAATEPEEPLTQLNRGSLATGSSLGDAPGAGDWQVSVQREEIWEGMENYAMLERIDEGGQGVVWVARHRSTHQRVAVKTLQRRLWNSRDARERFVKEVRLAALFKNKCVPSVLDSGVHRGVYFYAMELVQGLPLTVYSATMLSPLVKQERIEKVLDLFERICQGMDYIHRLDTGDPEIKLIVHGDLKPANIIVTPESEPKILDFGLAKTRGAAADNSSDAPRRGLCGTPAYMSPELIMDQLQGRYDRVDPRTDVYALGVILYQLLTGVMPFDGMDTAVWEQAVLKNPKEPRTLNKAISPSLEAVVKKAMNKEILMRYQSVAALLADIQDVRAGRPVASYPVGVVGRAWLWCQRRERVVEPGYYLTFLGIVFLLWTIAGIAGTAAGLQPVAHKGVAIAALLAQCLFFYGPMLVIGLLTIRQWLSAVWAGALLNFAITLCTASYVLGWRIALLQTGVEFQLPISIFILFTIFGAIGFLGYCIALVAYYSNPNAIALSRRFRRDAAPDENPSTHTGKNVAAFTQI